MNNLDLTELYGRSNNDIIVELGRRFRAYRIALRMTQSSKIRSCAMASGMPSPSASVCFSRMAVYQ